MNVFLLFSTRVNNLYQILQPTSVKASVQWTRALIDTFIKSSKQLHLDYQLLTERVSSWILIILTNCGQPLSLVSPKPYFVYRTVYQTRLLTLITKQSKKFLSWKVFKISDSCIMLYLPLQNFVHFRFYLTRWENYKGAWFLFITLVGGGFQIICRRKTVNPMILVSSFYLMGVGGQLINWMNTLL